MRQGSAWAYLRLIIAPLAAYAALFAASTITLAAIGALRGYTPSFHLHFILSPGAIHLLIQRLGPAGVVFSQVLGEAATLAAMAMCLRPDVGLRQVFDRPPRPSDFGLGLLATAGIMVLVEAAGFLLFLLHALKGSPSQQAFALGIGSPWLLLITALVAGFAEEATFRGYLLRALRGRMPLWLAVALESAAFAAFHVGWGLSAGPFIVIFAIGLALTLVAMRSHVYVAMVAHAGYDMLAFLAVLHLH